MNLYKIVYFFQELTILPRIDHNNCSYLTVRVAAQTPSEKGFVS